jgi:hypothetical protein
VFVERWTVDEVGDGVIRILAARSVNPDEVGPLAARSRAATAPALAEESGAEIMAIELGTGRQPEANDESAGAERADAESSWTEEQDSVLDAPAVAAFVAQFREQVPGAVARPLRETDVFWVVAPDVPVRALSDAGVRRSETELVLAGYRAVTPVVHDMTAPARQASKVLQHDAIQTSEEQS